jgi:hypothetical protein
MISGNANLHQMNTDILGKIFEEVTNQNKDEVIIFKEKYNQFIVERQYSDRDFCGARGAVLETEFEEVEDWIGNYISSLKQTQINSILCNYGINKALLLLRDFHTIGMGDTMDDVYEEIEMCNIEENMTKLILKDEVNFNSNWKHNG